jgi:hypothetical protein
MLHMGARLQALPEAHFEQVNAYDHNTERAMVDCKTQDKRNHLL